MRQKWRTINFINNKHFPGTLLPGIVIVETCTEKYRNSKYRKQGKVNIQTPKGLKIGEVARQLRIAVETIRMYEREGLILPDKTTGGQRVFSPEDVQWIHCIRRLIKQEGLNLEGIRRLLALLPCWELRPCSEAERLQCPAFLGASKPCWLIKERLPESCRMAECRKCNVYRSASRCENLKRLLYKIKHQQLVPTKAR